MTLHLFSLISQLILKPEQLLPNLFMSIAALGLGVDTRSVLETGGRVTLVVVLSLAILAAIGFGLIKLLQIS